MHHWRRPGVLNKHTQSMMKHRHHVEGSGLTLCLSTVLLAVLLPVSSLIQEINETPSSREKCDIISH